MRAWSTQVPEAAALLGEVALDAALSADGWRFPGPVSSGEQRGRVWLSERGACPPVFRGKGAEFTPVPSRATCSEARAG